MKDEWKDWFIDFISDKNFTLTNTSYSGISRNYKFYNIDKIYIPFHDEFRTFLKQYTGVNDFTYDTYHVHLWEEGSFFSTHKDDRDDRKFAYIYELQESDCKTKLSVEGKNIEEGWFDVYTKHEVPLITKGTRLSLTVFGKHTKNNKEVI